MEYKVNEWQELSLKKDIEKILKEISKHRKIDYAIMFDLIISIFSIIIDHYISEDYKESFIIITFVLIIFVSSSTLILSFISSKWCKKIKKNNIVAKFQSAEEMYEIFDNKVCYFIMMSETYYEMLKQSIANNDKNLSIFYYIETFYYINKIKINLFNMHSKIKEIFTDDSAQVIAQHMISFYRLKNIMDIIKNIESSISSIGENNLLDNIIEEVKEENNKYNIYYKIFIDEVNSIFDIKHHLSNDYYNL